MATLLLDIQVWDLCLDASGDIAVATEPYSQLQDVASECRVFRGECWYDVARGIPYFDGILGQPAPLSVLKEQLGAAAKRVPGITKATVYVQSITGRTLTGQIQTNAGVVAL